VIHVIKKFTTMKKLNYEPEPGYEFATCDGCGEKYLTELGTFDEDSFMTVCPTCVKNSQPDQGHSAESIKGSNIGCIFAVVLMAIMVMGLLFTLLTKHQTP
jgi:hypothetical protein